MRSFRHLAATAIAFLATLGMAQAQNSTPGVTTQLPGQVQVTGQIAAAPGSSLKVQLINCNGGQPRVLVGGATKATQVQTSYTIAVPLNGAVSFYLWPNDFISCSSTVGATEWQISYIQNGVPVRVPETFDITSTVNPFNITTQLPVNGLPPSVSNNNYHFGSLTLDENITALTGNFDIISASQLVLPNPLACDGTHFLNGFTASLVPICSPLPPGTGTSSPPSSQPNTLILSGGAGNAQLKSNISTDSSGNNLSVPGSENVTGSVSGSSFTSQGDVTAGGTVRGALNGPVTSLSINGIPQADQFAGADMCVKLRAANLYAIAQGIALVDASHFTGTQQCSVDPIGSLVSPGSFVNLTDNFGAVHVQTSVGWTITNPGLQLWSPGSQGFQVEYTGSTVIPAVLYIGSPQLSYYIQNMRISGIYLYGDSGNATDGILMIGGHHNIFTDVLTWGVTNCGFETQFAVTDTWYSPRTSSEDAKPAGIYGAAHTIPTSGLCLGQTDAAHLTTNGTIVDAAAEGLTGTGWILNGANNMVFTAGTSEGNTGQGAVITSASTANTFLGIDLESNGGTNMTDNGTSTVLINPIMDSNPIRVGPTSRGFSRIGGNLSPVLYDPAAFRPQETFGAVVGKTQSTFGTDSVTNAMGFQLASTPACTISAPAFGAFCDTSIKLPLAAVDPNYIPSCNLVQQAIGNNFLGAVRKVDSQNFMVRMFALDAQSGGGGFITCNVTHN